MNRVPGPTIIRDPSQEQVFASSLSSVPDQPKAPRAAGRLQPGIGHPHRDDGKDSKSALGFGSEWNPGPTQTVAITTVTYREKKGGKKKQNKNDHQTLRSKSRRPTVRHLAHAADRSIGRSKSDNSAMSTVSTVQTINPPTADCEIFTAMSISSDATFSDLKDAYSKHPAEVRKVLRASGSSTEPNNLIRLLKEFLLDPDIQGRWNLTATSPKNA